MATKMVPRGPLRPHWGAKVTKLQKRGEVSDSILEHFGIKMAPKCTNKHVYKEDETIDPLLLLWGTLLAPQMEQSWSF